MTEKLQVFVEEQQAKLEALMSSPINILNEIQPPVGVYDYVTCVRRVSPQVTRRDAYHLKRLARSLQLSPSTDDKTAVPKENHSQNCIREMVLRLRFRNGKTLCDSSSHLARLPDTLLGDRTTRRAAQEVP